MQQLVGGHVVYSKQLSEDQRRRLGAFAARVHPARTVLVEVQELCTRCNALLPLTLMVAVEEHVGPIERFRETACPVCSLGRAREQVRETLR